MKRIKERPIINLEQYGKVPPQAVDVEEAILGAFMLEADAYLMNPVNPEMFYKDQHRKICEVIQKMSKGQKKIDLLTVCRQIKDDGILEEIGGPLYIAQLTNQVSTVAHLSHHILILKDKYLRREMIRMSSELQSGAYDENIDLSEIIESAQEIFMKLLGDEMESVKSFTEISESISETIQSNATAKITHTGITTGFKKFDQFAHGMQPGDLVVIAGESSHGKTMLATNIVTHAAKQGYPCDVHSLEMSGVQLVSRIISIESGISAKDMLFQRLGPESITHINSHISKMAGLPIYFDDKSTASVQKICASIRKMVLKFGVKLVMVDYLQLVSGDASAGREEEIGQNARIFKNIAKELNIVVILLSQFSNSESHVPNTGRLRGSGQIKEAADLVILVWIPEINNIMWVKREDGTEESMKGKAGIIVGKGRNTGTMDFTVNCDRNINRMWDIESEFFEPINRIESVKREDDPF
jgi:replicative DNA helicase